MQLNVFFQKEYFVAQLEKKFSDIGVKNWQLNWHNQSKSPKAICIMEEINQFFTWILNKNEVKFDL